MTFATYIALSLPSSSPPSSSIATGPSIKFLGYGQELRRWLWSLAWFASCSFIMVCMQISGDGRYARLRNPQSGIYDLLLDGLPNLMGYSILNPDFMLNSFLLVSLVVALYAWSLEKLVKKSRRFLWLYGMGYLLRATTLAFTVLPPSDPACIPIDRTLFQSLSMTPRLLFGHGRTCTDKLFSGHTVLATLLLWFWWERPRREGKMALKWWPGRWYATIHFLIMASTSILGRHHYTVDIILSFTINSLTYWLYRSLLAINQEEAVLIDGISQLTAMIRWCEGLNLTIPHNNKGSFGEEIVEFSDGNANLRSIVTS